MQTNAEGTGSEQQRVRAPPAPEAPRSPPPSSAKRLPARDREGLTRLLQRHPTFPAFQGFFLQAQLLYHNPLPPPCTAEVLATVR